MVDDGSYPARPPEPEERPGVLRRVRRAVGGELRGRFLPLLQGMRLLFRAGLRPMLLFCLVFLIVQTAGTWLWEVERLIIGPQDLGRFWMPVSGLLSTFNDGVGSVLLACLLAAAVDRVLATQDDDRPPAAAGTPAPREPQDTPPPPWSPPHSGPGGRETPGWNQPTVNLA